MQCTFSDIAKRAYPLTESQAPKEAGPLATDRDVKQAQKLFTCEHGRTMNWKRARLALDGASRY